MEHGPHQPSELEYEGSIARQKLLAVWGQIQSYLFQIEILKRCDPVVGMRMINRLKLNVLMIRYLEKKLLPGWKEQEDISITPITYGVWSAIRRARLEGEVLLSALCDYVVEGNTRNFFVKSMSLQGVCPYHVVAELDTYGGPVTTEIKFLHDVENVLKQLNYCHLIINSRSVGRFMASIDKYLLKTLGSGSIVPPELYDPSQPCSVCFEELCVTANSGDSAHKRIVGKMCDHVTKQMILRVDPDDMVAHLPHATYILPDKLAVATTALNHINNPNINDTVSTNVSPDSVSQAAMVALDAHNVFLPASGDLYAISELQFWTASSGRKASHPQGNTIDSFADNLEQVVAKERLFDLRSSVIETALFDKRMNHFERIFSDEIEQMNTADRLLLGGRTAAPDDIIEALIKACYDHHLSAPLLKRLLYPDEAAHDALKSTLETLTSRSVRQDSAPKTSESTGDTTQVTPRDAHRSLSDARGDVEWLELVRAASADAARRRKMYAERLTKRSLASLDKCITEQRKELEKILRVNVYGEVLIDSYVAIFNGFRSRRGLLEAVQTRFANVIDNRRGDEAFDAYRFMQTALLKHKIDPAMLPSLTHKFFQLVNGPLFNHDVHRFAQPSNTALYFSVENVGLLPHLKEEMARFMLQCNNTSSWIISKFRGFYDFGGVDNITTAHRMAWKYIRELILATALFASVFKCGDLQVCRADGLQLTLGGEYIWEDGVYLTYETDCPLVALIGCRAYLTHNQSPTVLVDTDVFSLLYSILQFMAPATADQLRSDRFSNSHTHN
ncbi:UL28 DNA packaging protein [Meleagrid alphaherpesvirus 1]|uniref:UL28 DNA packaging protein n=2 Tax=Meleagrid herpesvirus 1 TaxID=37108 RepID=Q9DGW3_MEHV1|nr:DNA packaging terminase subunit 2 [Meleagrid alphaherpesvirus 1]AKQ48595.1 DNA packaging terminase subunit 2 [iBAC vector pMeHV1-C7]AKQ48667.1 DNA packaging terminase subunit 2 [iBAC vector pMeHV1-C9]AKQ48739.1 DNA packaging terminase subunit 2 [iBAC vector pMeHV1-C10]AKQ48811.1 DNA packaging terminase subunit 2 [iBAC vector pMeHV1-C17]AKQ48883.1 DNA packaging terminase subunit 2 [iBAC vector pMeHV1-C18]